MAAKKKVKTKSKKKAPAKKSAVKKAAPAKKKAAAKKPAPKKTTAKKPAVKRAAAKAPAPKKPAVVQPAAPRAVPPRRPAVSLSAVAVPPRALTKPQPAPVVPEHAPLPGEHPIGVVTHYYSQLSVAVVELDAGSLEVGDTVRFIGHTTDCRQRVDSLEVNHRSVAEVGRRQAFGMKVKEHVREHDVVYKVVAD